MTTDSTGIRPIQKDGYVLAYRWCGAGCRLVVVRGFSGGGQAGQSSASRRGAKSSREAATLPGSDSPAT
jgi:hypothetical protein